MASELSNSAAPAGPVHAIVRAGSGRWVGAAREAIGAQEVAVAGVHVVERWREAGAADGWLWLLDAGVVPAPGALAALLAAAAVADVVIVAGAVQTPAGALDDGSLPVAETRVYQRILDALGRGELALRAVRAGSLLVRAELGELPQPGQELAWSARVAWSAELVMAGDSRAVRHEPPAALGALTRARHHARLLAAVPSSDRIWFAAELGRRELSRLAGRRRPS